MENLSKEQLLTYIKKQKIKIKQLEADNENLTKSATTTEKVIGKPPEPSLFWATIHNEKNPFYKKLSVAALGRFVDTVEHVSSPQLDKRAAFLTWKVNFLQTKLKKSEQSLTDSKAQLQQSEQRVLKLKTLLARTHQSKQKTMEDTSMYKKAQEESAAALRDLKEREQQERDALRETLRAQSIQSAFQQDTEIALQRAAEELVSRQQMLAQTNVSAGPGPARVQELEKELQNLRAEVQQLTQSLGAAKLQVERQESRIALQAQELSEYSQTHRTGSNEVDRLRAKLFEETQSRQDLEREVKLLLSTRASMAREIENIAVARKSQELLLALADLEETRIQLELSQEALRSLNAELDDQQVEVNRLRRAAADASQLRLECHQLRSTIVDLRRTTRSAAPVAKQRPELPEGLSLIALSDLREALLEFEAAALEGLRREGELLSALRQARQEAVLSRWVSERRDENHQLVRHGMVAGVSRQLLGQLSPFGSFEAYDETDASVVLRKLDLCCQALTERIGSLAAAAASLEEAQAQTVDEFKPMTWETNGLIVNANSDIPILIPLPTLTTDEGCSGSLSWHIFSDSLQSLSLSLTASPPLPSGPMGKIPQYPLTLVSVMAPQHINNSPTLCGTYEVSIPPNIVLGQGTLLLKVHNSGMWGSIKIGYKITFGPTDASGRADASTSVRQKIQSQVDDHRVEIARLSAELAFSERLRARVAVAVGSGRKLHEEFYTWLQRRGLDLSKSLPSLTDIDEEAPAPGLSTDDAARFELLWSHLSHRSERLNEKRTDLQAALAVIKTTCPSRPSVPAKSPKPAVASSSSRGTSQDSGGSDVTAVYSCDSLLLKAARDFRLQVPLLPGRGRRFGVRWELSLVFASANHAREQTVGFSILRRQPDGLLPQVEPYKLLPAVGGQGFVEVDGDDGAEGGGGTTLIFLFDNTFSWYRQKRIRYKIEVFEMDDEAADDPAELGSLAAASQDSLVETALQELETAQGINGDFNLAPLSPTHGDVNIMETDFTSSQELVEWVRRTLEFTNANSVFNNS